MREFFRRRPPAAALGSTVVQPGDSVPVVLMCIKACIVTSHGSVDVSLGTTHADGANWRLISEGIPSYEETIEALGEYPLFAQPAAPGH